MGATERLLPRAEVERPAQVSSARLRNRCLTGLAAQIERSVPPDGRHALLTAPRSRDVMPSRSVTARPPPRRNRES